MKTFVNFCKHFQKHLSIILLTVIGVFFSVSAFAQSDINLTDLGNMFSEIATMVPVVIFISSGLNNLLSLKKFAKQLVSWVIAIGLAYIGWFVKLGMFADQSWWSVGLIGLGVALVSNGLFDIPTIKSFLKFLKIEAKTISK